MQKEHFGGSESGLRSKINHFNHNMTSNNTASSRSLRFIYITCMGGCLRSFPRLSASHPLEGFVQPCSRSLFASMPVLKRPAAMERALKRPGAVERVLKRPAAMKT